jgi:hypothetical protein
MNTVKVKLLSDGGYRKEGEPSLIGKVFNATPWWGSGYDIIVADLVAAGLVTDCADLETALYWTNEEVEVVL